ncbi:MAG: hypothetical protein ACP6IS_03755 [Candidatus Asgardarchaeia archaeon]
MSADLNSMIENFVSKYNVKEVLFATKEGMPIAYYSKDKSENQELHLLSAKVSSLIAIAQTITPEVDYVTVNNGQEKIIVIGDDDYVLKIKSDKKQLGLITIHGRKLFKRLIQAINK